MGRALLAEEKQPATCAGPGRTGGWPRTHRRQAEVGHPRALAVGWARQRRWATTIAQRDAIAGEGGLRGTGRPSRICGGAPPVPRQGVALAARAQRRPEQGLRWHGANGERSGRRREAQRSLITAEARGAGGWTAPARWKERE
ncbi:hypothetical protein PVAP13_3NG056500 [Panicum virgatum]|uniref:Uncharacterized protein n=1 Tax=Panicum virgatum TaxID=38727 RepID=A0A8T0TU26_PANVG|nr:hypothetical protein PVAP13_3NG056500 [Panicum virgatum]